MGAPWDGDPRATWATYDGNVFEMRRTEYDIERAVAGARSLGDAGEGLARSYYSGSR